MSLNRPKSPSRPATLTVNLSEAWDTAAEMEILLERIRAQVWYRIDLLYSGFNGEQPARRTGEIFCTDEEDMVSFGPGSDSESPICYANSHPKPALAVYDPTKVIEKTSIYGYRFEDPSALLAVIRLKH